MHNSTQVNLEDEHCFSISSLECTQCPSTHFFALSAIYPYYQYLVLVGWKKLVGQS